jgi:hypothetical protein
MRPPPGARKSRRTWYPRREPARHPLRRSASGLGAGGRAGPAAVLGADRPGRAHAPGRDDPRVRRCPRSPSVGRCPTDGWPVLRRVTACRAPIDPLHLPYGRRADLAGHARGTSLPCRPAPVRRVPRRKSLPLSCIGRALPVSTPTRAPRWTAGPAAGGTRGRARDRLPAPPWGGRGVGRPAWPSPRPHVARLPPVLRRRPRRPGARRCRRPGRDGGPQQVPRSAPTMPTARGTRGDPPPGGGR